MIYIFIFVLLVIVSLFDLVSISSRTRKVCFYALIFLFIIVGSIKWNTGPDWASYYEFFRDMPYYLDNDLVPFEPGFEIFNRIIRHFTDSYLIFTIIFVSLTIWLKARFFVNNFKTGLLLILLIYFSYYLADIFAVRQFLAISITVYSTRYILEKRLGLFLIFCLLAASIHASALLFIFGYWIYHLNIGTRYLVFAVVTCLILGALNVSDHILRASLGLLPLGDVIYVKLQSYSEGERTSGGSSLVAFILGTFKRCLFLPVFLFFKERVKEDIKRAYSGFVNLLLFGNCIYFLFALSLPVITRLSTYYLFYEVFLLTWTILSMKDLKLRFVSYAVLVLFCGMRLYSFILPYKELYVPYHTIFEEEEVDTNR